MRPVGDTSGAQKRSHWAPKLADQSGMLEPAKLYMYVPEALLHWAM